MIKDHTPDCSCVVNAAQPINNLAPFLNQPKLASCSLSLAVQLQTTMREKGKVQTVLDFSSPSGSSSRLITDENTASENESPVVRTALKKKVSDHDHV